MSLSPTTTYATALFEQPYAVTAAKKLFPVSTESVTLANTNAAAYTKTVGSVSAGEWRPHTIVTLSTTLSAEPAAAVVTLDATNRQVGDIVDVVFTPSEIISTNTIAIKDQAATPNTLATLSATSDVNLSISRRSFRLTSSATWTQFANTGLTSTSTLTIGPIVGNVQALSGAGAVNVTTLSTKVTTTGANALTLADGTNGQLKTIVMVADGGDGTLTPTTKTGYSTIKFTDVGNAVILQFFTTLGWMIVSNYGTTVA